uniref:Uncharacterized protein n=1 Tax=Hucho hucho TaxID=62062 RepID=A0A4W5R105_9TELE
MHRAGGPASHIPRRLGPAPVTTTLVKMVAGLPERWDWRDVNGVNYLLSATRLRVVAAILFPRWECWKLASGSKQTTPRRPSSIHSRLSPAPSTHKVVTVVFPT